MSSKMINLRLRADELQVLERFVERANDRAEAIGLPRDITLSGILRLWIRDRLAREDVAQEASHVNAALEKLRAAR